MILPPIQKCSTQEFLTTTGRIPGSTPADPPIWDLGRSPYNPEDCYISELVASLTQIGQGITTGVDTSQISHTPEHTDAMIQGLMDSGRRSLYVYTGGRADDNRGGYEYPGTIGNSTTGLVRLRAQWFNAGQLRKWDGKLVGVDVDRLRHQIEASRDAVLARIQAVPIPIDSLHSAPGYTPSFLGSCCIAEEYGARP